MVSSYDAYADEYVYMYGETTSVGAVFQTANVAFLLCVGHLPDACALVWKDEYKGGRGHPVIMHKSEVKNGQRGRQQQQQHSNRHQRPMMMN